MKVIQTEIKSTDYYTILDLDSFGVGDVLVFDIFIKKNNNYIVIIEAGTVLSKSLYTKLEKQEKLYIFKKDKEKLSLTCESLKFYIKHNKDNLEKRISLLCDTNNKLFESYLNDEDDRVDLTCVNLIIKSILYLIKYDKEFLKNSMPYFLPEHTLSNHSLHVTIYALNLGNLLQLNTKELLSLGIAALLYDIGFKKIDNSLIIKNTKLDMAELKEVQKHSKYSVEILKHNNVNDPYILDAIMHHHEQYDGNGYPHKLKEKDITPFASILSICDVFDALTSQRAYRKQYTSFNAIKMMLKDESMAGKFNHKYLQTLLKSISS